MLALTLTGGRGTRLGKLIQNIARPATQFGGCYCIIDFALSNCADSGADNVGIIIQYRPLALNGHAGNGSNWGIDGINLGITVLQLCPATEGNRWFEGTSHATYQNIDYINSIDPEYTLILSGDHTYKMDYDDMFRTHKDNLVSLTVAIIDAPLKEASRFDIMGTDSNGHIVEFGKKPEHPKSTKTSMGIYIFNWQRLREVLVSAEKDNVDMSDFGKDVVPAYLEAGNRVYTYNLNSYWKDVRIIESFQEANMEYIDGDNELYSRGRSRKVYSKNPTVPPNFITEEASVKSFLVVDGCLVSGKANHPILSTNVQVKKDTEVTDSFIISGTIIGEGAKIKRVIVDENAVIGDGIEIDGTGKEAQIAGYNEVVGAPNED